MKADRRVKSLPNEVHPSQSHPRRLSATATSKGWVLFAFFEKKKRARRLRQREIGLNVLRVVSWRDFVRVCVFKFC